VTRTHRVGSWLHRVWSGTGAFVLLLVVGAALFRLPGLGAPAEEYFDEVYHAKAARQYIDGAAPVEWVHPPMAKHLIAVGVRLFGYEPWAWRLVPALFGTALAPLFYLLARRVTSSERAARLAAIILLLDGVYLVQSRIAMTNIFAVFFQVVTMWLLVGAVLEERLPAIRTLLAGGAFGLALATRWTSLFASGFVVLVVVVVRGTRLLRIRDLALLMGAFVFLPALIYVSSYVPLVYLRPGLQPWGGSLARLLDLQIEVWNYHAQLNATHPYYSAWYTWPFLVRPTWYYFKQNGEMLRGIIAIGNPAIWWACVPVTAWALVSGVRSHDPRRLFAASGFLMLYLPWGLSPRTLNYSHYLFEAIPYACLALGILLDRLWDTEWGVAARAWLASAVFLFLLFSPLLMGLLIPAQWFHYRFGGLLGVWTWFRSWV
jgi:dolichyl-phosphate-mannose-protein mannosyltransferase